MTFAQTQGRVKAVRWPPRCWHMIDEIDLVELIAEHRAWLRLCARLEAIADMLPDLPEADEVRLLRAQIEGLVPPFDTGADAMFDTLLFRERARPMAKTLLEGFGAARGARAIDAQDILAALEAGRSDRAGSANEIGYMLRSFFRGCRDAVALEQLTLFALANDRLTAGARALLVERLAESCEIKA